MVVSLSRSEKDIRANAMPAGTILPFAGSVAPDGFLICDGSSLNKAEFVELFNAIGTAWGTADVDSFNIPDLRGRTLRGVDAGAGNDPDAGLRTQNAAGGNVGDMVGTVQGGATALPGAAFNTANAGNHVHTFRNLINVTLSAGVRVVPRNDAAKSLTGDMMGNAGTHGHSIDTGGDNETRMVNANCTYIIKYE